MAPIYFCNGEKCLCSKLHDCFYYTIAIAIHPSIYLVASGYYLHSQPVNTYQKISQQKALTNCSFQQRGIFQKHLCWSLARFNYVVLVFHVDVTQTVAVYLDLIRTVRQSSPSPDTQSINSKQNSFDHIQSTRLINHKYKSPNVKCFAAVFEHCFVKKEQTASYNRPLQQAIFQIGLRLFIFFSRDSFIRSHYHNGFCQYSPTLTKSRIPMYLEKL